MARDLPTYLRAIKTLARAVEWVEAENGKLWLAVPLDIDGATIEGLQLRGRAIKDLPNEEVTLLLECSDPIRRDRAMDRIDWRPLHTHNNRGKGPQELRHMMIKAGISHRHSFDLNWIAAENRLRQENLPIAAPIALEIKDFGALLEFAGECFNINNLVLPAPPWERALL